MTTARIAAVSSLLLVGSAFAPAVHAGPEALVLQVSDATVYEGDAGTTLASFQVRRIGQFTGKEQTVSYTTVDGDAVAGDYVEKSGTLTFDKKTDVRTVVVEVVGDVAQEPDEYFLLVVSNTGGGDPEGRGRILNDDGWPDS